MRSYDFFDTLCVRLAANPTDVFRILAQLLEIENFADLRITAELMARSASASGEVDLEHIYNFLPLDSDVRRDAFKLEKNIEEAFFRPIKTNVNAFSADCIIVSDTYFTCTEMSEYAERIGIEITPDRIFSSSDMGKSKARGSIWAPIQDAVGIRNFKHTGDNFRADWLSPILSGLRGQIFLGSRLSRYEKVHNDGSIDGSLIAGISRATRLAFQSRDLSVQENCLHEVYAGVFCPLFHAFVEDIIEQSISRNIKKIYFMSRDGQLLYLIAKRIVEARGLNLNVRYVFGSRQSLHCAAPVDDTRALSWIIESTSNLALRSIAMRCGIDSNELYKIAQDYFHEPVGLDKALSAREREQLEFILVDPRFLQLLRDSVDSNWRNAFGYYLQEGIDGSEDIAFVDVGWHGRIQVSLHKILEKGGVNSRSNGFYLCLSRNPTLNSGLNMSSYLFRAGSDLARQLDPFRPIVEACLAADHGSTASFDCCGDRYQPVLMDGCSDKELRRVKTQQDMALHFTDNKLAAEKVVGRRVITNIEHLRTNLRSFLIYPRWMDACAFNKFGFAENQGDSRERDFTSSVFGMFFGGGDWSFGIWKEGTLARNRLSFLLPLLRLLRIIKTWVFRD